MISRFRKTVGRIRRAAIGVLDTWFDGFPSLPSGIPQETIGTSVGGRPIVACCIGKGDRIALIVAGIHGNEVGTVKVAGRIIDWLHHDQPFPGLSVYVIPCLNPDGLAQARKRPDYLNGGRIGRFNARGVDLNRNFDVPSFTSTSVWSFGNRYSENQEVFCGTTPLSEPETQALVRFVQEKRVSAMIAMHNAGADVTPAADAPSRKIAELHAAASGYRLVDDEEWEGLGQTGTCKEWAHQEGITYIETEGASRWGSDADRQMKGTEAVLKSISAK